MLAESSALNHHNRVRAENSLFGGNLSEQLAQGRDLGIEPESPSSNSKCANH